MPAHSIDVGEVVQDVGDYFCRIAVFATRLRICFDSLRRRQLFVECRPRRIWAHVRTLFRVSWNLEIAVRKIGIQDGLLHNFHALPAGSKIGIVEAVGPPGSHDLAGSGRRQAFIVEASYGFIRPQRLVPGCMVA
jgi:hypothetical protein